MPAPPFPATSSDKLNMPHRTRQRCRPPTYGLLCVAYVAVAQLQCCTAFWALPQPSMMSVRQRQVIRLLPDTSQTATTAAVGRGGRGVLSCCTLGCGRFSSSSRRGGRENDSRRRRLVGGGGLQCSVPSSGELLASDVGEPAGSDEATTYAIAEDECFLAVDGAEYCVTERRQQQLTTVSGVSLETEAFGQEKGGVVVSGEGVGTSNPRSLYTMMGLCFLVAIVCALDRVAMSVAIVPMGNVYDYTDTTKGLISSVFSWGYMASMVPSSVLIGVWGPKVTMTVGVLAWSAAQMLSPLAASTSLQTLLACRFAMGVGEAVTLPSIQAIVADWVPQDQRSRWLSLIISGLQIGTVLAYVASPPIIEAWNWQGVFLTYGALGLAWLALWLPLVPDKAPDSLSAGASEAADGSQLPQQPPREEDSRLAATSLPAAVLPTPVPATKRDGAQLAAPAAAVNRGSGENNFLGVGTVALAEGAGMDVELSFRKGGSASDKAVASGEDRKEGVIDGPPLSREGGVLGGFRDVPWKEYATNGQIWSIAAAHMSHNWGLYVMLAWLPTYFNQEFNLSLVQSSGASVIPWVAGAITGNMAGWGADALVNKGILGLRAVRTLFQTLALVGPAACMLALAQGPETSTEASLFFTITVALGSCSSAGFGSSVQDLRSKDTGVIYGMTSACAAVVGSAGTYLTGVVLDTTDSWAFVFQVTAAVYLLGAGLYGGFYRAEPLVLKPRA